MSLDRAWISSHIPHQGAMCLIDEVLAWTEKDIRCRTASHRLKSNPLKTAGRLRSECGIEYAAQAIAIHGVLRGPQLGATPVAGMLVSARGVKLHVDHLDDIEDDLVVRATRIAGDLTALLYDFSIARASETLLAGRASIVLRGPETASSSAGSHE
jgi:predicted hotdog family 3-hydroxylacyl-ACP dehydratase